MRHSATKFSIRIFPFPLRFSLQYRKNMVYYKKEWTCTQPRRSGGYGFPAFASGSFLSMVTPACSGRLETERRRFPKRWGSQL